MDTTPPDFSDSSLGYQWKSLFLPHGTLLRITVSHNSYFARVEGEHIMYEGCSVSPRGFTLATAGQGRNAWRDLWIKFPAERYWKGANRCRIQAQPVATALGLSPEQSMQMAAAAMKEALEAALALVRHGCAQRAQRCDRRMEGHRRHSDVLDDDCAY